MHPSLKLGLIQASCVLGDVPANLRAAEELCRKAAADGADLLCLPEVCTSGYLTGPRAQAGFAAAAAQYESLVESFSRVARQCGSYLVAPLPAPQLGSAPAALYNSALVFDPQGRLIERYDKVHLWQQEREIFQPGDRFATFDTPFGRVGLLICYDLCFPEAARILSLQGAELLLAPAAWSSRDRESWSLVLPQRAQENIMAVAGVNGVLDSPELRLFGQSQVFDARGRALGGLEERPGYAVVTVDMALVRRGRERLSLLRDRRPEVYRGLIEERLPEA